MKNKYIIIADDNLPADIENRISTYLQSKQLNFWHWIHNVWLIAETEYPMDNLRDEVRHLASSGTLLIFAIDKDNLKGFAPQNSAKWIMENWKK